MQRTIGMWLNGFEMILVSQCSCPDQRDGLSRFPYPPRPSIASTSLAYSGSVLKVIEQSHIGQEVATLRIPLFTLGFATGSLLWASLSETEGRQVLSLAIDAVLTAFNAGAAGAQNIQTLHVVRFLAGSVESSR